MPDTSGSVDLNNLSQDEQEALGRLADERGGPIPDSDPKQEALLTTFIVMVDKEGSPTIGRFNDPDLPTLSEPTTDLIFQACHALIQEITAVKTAQAVVQATMQQAQLMAQQQQDAFLQQQVQQNLRSPRG